MNSASGKAQARLSRKAAGASPAADAHERGILWRADASPVDPRASA